MHQDQTSHHFNTFTTNLYYDMPKRALSTGKASSSSAHASSSHEPSNGHGSEEEDHGMSDPALKKPRTFMATLACDKCRARKSRCDEDKPRCGYCRANDLECTYQTPRPTKKDQSMAVAINAIRRLEAKVESLTEAVEASNANVQVARVREGEHASPFSTPAQAHSSPAQAPNRTYSTFVPERGSAHGAGVQRSYGTEENPYAVHDELGRIHLSFSQHGVSLWPAIKEILSPEFTAARELLPREYIVDIESTRAPLPIDSKHHGVVLSEQWLARLPLSAIKGLAEAYFAVFNRSTPVLDKYHFFSNTLPMAMDSYFGYDVETCVVLNVLALGCLAVKTHEEGNFPLPSKGASARPGFTAPDWYDLTLDDPPGLNFFNEGRKRLGYLICRNDLQTAQFYMLTTMYYAQILRPIDSWTTVNRASLCCISILKRNPTISPDTWESDMFSRIFWCVLMYETIITQELDLPLSGLLDYEADMPIPRFTPCPRPTSSHTVSTEHEQDEDSDAYFSYHFLAQAAHRILLTRIRTSLYTFQPHPSSPSPSLTAEMHHQIETWRSNLPPSLQFPSPTSNPLSSSRSPAHVLAKAMLQSRYLVAKFHIGRPFLYKALHYPASMTEPEYAEIAACLEAGMYWPTTMGACLLMRSGLPVKFGWTSQCFGQVLLFEAVARSGDERLVRTLPEGWREWVGVMGELIGVCGESCPGIGKDAELLGLL